MLLGFLAATPAFAARAPDAVEKTIEFAGPAAIELGTLFGLTPSGQHFTSFRLGSFDAWCVYLLKKDTRDALDNDNNGSPGRYNSVEFRQFVPALVMSSYWLNLGTRSPDQKVGDYSFGSPFLPEALNTDDSWTQLMRRLKTEPGWRPDERVQWHRCYVSKSKLELCLDVYGADSYVANEKAKGYAVEITARTALASK